MLKLIFWLLLAVNGALYAYGQGYLGHFSGNEREPARLKNQQNADKLALIPAAKANAAAAALKPAAPATADTPAEKKTETVACYEVGNFVLADARRFEAAVAPLDLGDHQARRNMPGTEVSSYIVHIPSQGSKEGADKKAAELRGLGVSNYFIMADNPAMRWAISLGVFKTEAAAQNQLAMLQKQGVHSARVAPRMSGSKLLAFQFRDISADVKAQLEGKLKAFPSQEGRSCK
ncbi:SPOR domain-containing protein [Pseudoduganella aquatica]|uniref:SPOR domain-containing protein n=1 Tax=Pseudoduganella aquatica TaxID=2660641 RepID=A0A7X4HA10_9BURK|nr:SPOR domain-containing protein [Pseudoduganella aquatica]MYN07381.1 SPOR domain-containing protein [Pseudoduganella aquatica]